MDQKAADRHAVELGKEYLLSLRKEGVTAEILDKYLCGARSKRLPTIPNIFLAMLKSAQNSNMKSGVIGRALGGVERLAAVLFEFDPHQVLKEYISWEPLLDRIIIVLKPRGKIRREKRSIWPQYCSTILSAARFMTEFKSAEEFYAWCDGFVEDDQRCSELPLILANEIKGYGFALACDFLKENGYSNYGKPDVHVCRIFEALCLCPQNSSAPDVLEAIMRVARNANLTPYAVDKLFWLIGSGYFYLDSERIGHRGRLGSQKLEFIEFASKRMNIKEA